MPLDTPKFCEVIVSARTFCSREATMRYPAHGGGYMHLCESHGEKHDAYSEHWDGVRWVKRQAAGQETRP